MSEVLIGKARHARLGNDLFWEFLEYDKDMPGHFIDLKWCGYNDADWWNKWSKGTETKEQGGRRFRIDFATCDVYELTEVLNDEG